MPVVDTYCYTDELGVTLYEKDRIEPGKNGRKKDFAFRSPAPEGGWVSGVEGVRRVLFNLPAVLAAVGDIALVCGEKDARTASRIGMVATTNDSGEATRWISDDGNRADFVAALTGKHILFFPDQDDAGSRHRDDVVSALDGVAASLAVVNVPVGKDLTEYIESGATSRDLNKLIEVAKLPENHPVARMQKLVRKRATLTAIESEKLVLGSVMSGKTPFGEIDHLSVHDFSIESHKIIFEALRGLSKDVTDRAAVIQFLEDRDKLEEAGGLTALLDMTEDLPAVYDIEAHAEKIQGRSGDRKLLGDLCKATTDLIVGDDPEEIRQRILAAANATAGHGSIYTRDVKTIVGDIDKFLAPRPLGIMCKPLQPLFEDFRGFQPGQLVIIGGRPSEGKSAIGTLIWAYSAAQGFPTEILSLEVGVEDTVLKMACMIAKVPYLSVISGNLTSRQRNRLYETIRQLETLPLKVDDRSDWTINKIKTHLRRRRAAGKPIRMLGIDYLQLLNTAGKQRHDLEVSAITRGLKLAALEFGCTIVLLSQLSRENEKQGRPPILSDLRESGGIEQDADIVIFVHQERSTDSETEFERSCKIILAKQRNGPTRTHEARFSKPFALFFFKEIIKPLDYDALMG